MTEDGSTGGWRPVEGAWGRVTLVLHLLLFAVPAASAWASTLNSSFWLPVVALPVTCVAGLLMLWSGPWRGVGARVVAASALAAVLEVVLAIWLVLMYAEQHPGWDLS